MPPELKEQVQVLISLLIAEKYAEVEALTGGVRLPAEQIRDAIEQYGRTLRQPPSEAYERMDVVEVQGSAYPQWSITIPLWTKEEGSSDLSLSITIVAKPTGFATELDDIHVL